MLIST
ncbi:hypothetical protein VTN00DRAFT_10451 [Thermoascus crustaceus]